MAAPGPPGDSDPGPALPGPSRFQTKIMKPGPGRALGPVGPVRLRLRPPAGTLSGPGMIMMPNLKLDAC